MSALWLEGRDEVEVRVLEELLFVMQMNRMSVRIAHGGAVVI